MAKIISISLSPNTQTDDVVLAFGLLLRPWHLKNGNVILELEKSIQERFALGPCFSFNSGRSCLLAALEAIGIAPDDEIILQAFTCNAVVNPILKMQAQPVYVDIGIDLNMDVKQLEQKITSKTKAIIAQHTFGMPCDIEAIQELCKKYNLVLIEDCAHALGAKINNQYCGSFGDLAFFSFGRDKVISCVYGGAVAVNNPKFLDSIKKFQNQTKFPSIFWTLQQLLHPVLVNSLILPLYQFFIGKVIMALSINLHLLSKSVTKIESQGKLPAYFPLRLPNALAILACNQLRKLDRFNNHRQEIAAFYASALKDDPNFEIVFKNIDETKEPIYLKYPLINKNNIDVLFKMKEHNIYLNDGWHETAVMPSSIELKKMHYDLGSCQLAEKISQSIIYLPTHINLSINDAKKIVYLLKT